MFPDNLTRDEAFRRSGMIDTQTYVVDVDLSGAGANSGGEVTHFTSRSTIGFTARAAGALHVDLIADSLQHARLDGVELDPQLYADSRLPFVVTEGVHELVVEATCRYSRSGEGLHRFVDPVDGSVYLYTQFEAANARRVYACFEQPDLKARFTLSVVAPSDWQVVSGSTATAGTPAGEGLTRTEFAPTPPISTYLTSLVAGPYHAVSRDHDGVAGRIPMRLLCRRSLADHLDADELFAVTAGGFEVFERQFGVPYPFGKYDQVFVPEYNGGAMENVGCVTLRDDYLFRSRTTQATRDYRRDTVLHELAHMWFGDLVTMRWWDDLWLKESFATWASAFCVSEQADDPGLVWAAFRSGSKNYAYRQDQLSTTHPISADIVDLEALEFNFDQITYAKGASVLVQLVAYVGRQGFLEGVRDYFAAHAYGNTSLVDLLQSLEKSCGRDLTDWSARWLETAGVNTLTLELGEGADGRLSSAAIRQTAAPAWPVLRPHRLAVGLYDRRDGALVRTDRLELDVDGERTELPQLLGRRRPDVFVLNDDDLTYAKTRLDAASLRVVSDELPAVASVLTRAVLWGALWDACRDAELPAATFARLVLRAVGGEVGGTTVRNVLAQGATATYAYSPLSERDELAQTWETGLRELLAEAAAGSDLQLSLARQLCWAASVASADLLQAWLGGDQVPPGLEIDTDFRWLVVGSLARLGVLDEGAIEVERRRDSSNTGTEQAAGARAARPDAAAKAEAWRLTVESDTIPNSVQSAICLSFWQRGQDELLAPYVDRYFEVAEDISALRGVWATKGASLRNSALRNLFPVPRDPRSFLDRLDAWLVGADLTPSTRRAVTERRDDTVRALRCQSVSG